MKKYREQIQKYKEVVEKQYISDEVKDQTIKTCKNILSGLTVEKQIP